MNRVLDTKVIKKLRLKHFFTTCFTLSRIKVLNEVSQAFLCEDFLKCHYKKMIGPPPNNVE